MSDVLSSSVRRFKQLRASLIPIVHTLAPCKEDTLSSSDTTTSQDYLAKLVSANQLNENGDEI